MTKKRIAILFGGASSEHEVSRVSAESVLNNISKEKYEIFCIGINKSGEWFLYNGPFDKIGNGKWEFDPCNEKAFIVPDSKAHGMFIINKDKYEFVKIDVVFPVLHGKNGEDGSMQGLLQLSGIPYVGCDITSSAACMDKVITNVLLRDGGIKKANFTYTWANDFIKNKENVLDQIEKNLPEYPLFVKPSNAGSSVGISKANNREELCSAIKLAIKEDKKILIEETINGQEVECAVLGNDNPIASLIGEIAPINNFYDYEAKYERPSKLFIPAHIDDLTSKKIREEAVKAYKIMNCSGFSRIDFFVEKDTKKVILNEINTIPGFTSISMYPKLMQTIGVSYVDLIDNLIELALKRHNENVE